MTGERRKARCSDSPVGVKYAGTAAGRAVVVVDLAKRRVGFSVVVDIRCPTRVNPQEGERDPDDESTSTGGNLVKETGGKMYYTGRDMALSHQGMGINEADWERFIEIVTSVAGELGVGATEGGEVMAFLDSLKADIVTA